MYWVDVWLARTLAPVCAVLCAPVGQMQGLPHASRIIINCYQDSEEKAEKSAGKLSVEAMLLLLAAPGGSSDGGDGGANASADAGDNTIAPTACSADADDASGSDAECEETVCGSFLQRMRAQKKGIPNKAKPADSSSVAGAASSSRGSSGGSGGPAASSSVRGAVQATPATKGGATKRDLVVTPNEDGRTKRLRANIITDMESLRTSVTIALDLDGLVDGVHAIGKGLDFALACKQSDNNVADVMKSVLTIQSKISRSINPALFGDISSELEDNLRGLQAAKGVLALPAKQCAPHEIREVLAQARGSSVLISCTFHAMEKCAQAEEHFMFERFGEGINVFQAIESCHAAGVNYCEDYLLRLWRKLSAADFATAANVGKKLKAERRLLDLCCQSCLGSIEKFGEKSMLSGIQKDITLIAAFHRPDQVEHDALGEAVGTVTTWCSTGIPTCADTPIVNELVKGKLGAVALSNATVVYDEGAAEAKKQKTKQAYDNALKSVSAGIVAYDDDRAATGDIQDCVEQLKAITSDLPEDSGLHAYSEVAIYPTWSVYAAYASLAALL